MGAITPDANRLAAFARGDDDGPVVMINLLRFRERAEYPAGFAATPCSGREAYERYGELAAREIAAIGGRVLWHGSVHETLIAPAGEEWHRAVLVQYPSRKAFLTMIRKPSYQAIAPHRAAALEDSRLIASRTTGEALPSRAS